MKGWYVVVRPNNKEYVGQLCVDSNIPVCLFENEKFKTEDEAKSRAAELRTLSGINTRFLRINGVL